MRPCYRGALRCQASRVNVAFNHLLSYFDPCRCHNAVTRIDWCSKRIRRAAAFVSFDVRTATVVATRSSVTVCIDWTYIRLPIGQRSSTLYGPRYETVCHRPGVTIASYTLNVFGRQLKTFFSDTHAHHPAPLCRFGDSGALYWTNVMTSLLTYSLGHAIRIQPQRSLPQSAVHGKT